MTTALTFSLCERLNPLRLAGPLLDKELRVSSRRSRTYILRIGYVAIMCLFALAAWYSIIGVPKANMASWGVSRSSLVGVRVTTHVLWFQFMAAQLIAAAMLSSSMADEIHRGGLSILLTTPISSIQIVLGKLFSRMWQVILLLTISLPALAVIRVMGGTTWDSLTSSFCITLTASLFVGAMCLWLSTYCRYPHQVISTAAVIYLIVFVALPAVAMVVFSIAKMDNPLVSSIIALANPRSTLIASIYPPWYRRPLGPGYFHSWPIHCLIMLGLTVVLLGLSACRIRRVSVRGPGLGGANGPCRTFQCHCPIILREFVGNLSYLLRWSLLLVIGVATVCALIVVGRIVLGRGSLVIYHARSIAWVCWTIALLHLTVLASGAIGREKAGRTLPLLLTTPLDERRIVRRKLREVVDRGIPWVVAAFAVETCYGVCAVNWEDTLAALCYALAVLVSAFFVTTAGLYFGARLKTTAAAVVVTVGTHLFLRYVVVGYYNPIFVWLRYKVLLAPGAGMATMSLFNWGPFLVVAVLEVGIGLSMLRRTPRILRRYA